MKTLSITLMTLICSAIISQARDPVVGDWKWNRAHVVKLSPQGEASNSKGDVGKWERGPGRTGEYNYVITWPKWVNTVSLSKDRKLLSGTNQDGSAVSAERWK